MSSESETNEQNNAIPGSGDGSSDNSDVEMVEDPGISNLTEEQLSENVY